MKKVLLIIPAYNEETNILNVCSEIEDYKKKSGNNSAFSLDYVVINDGSSDSTEKICLQNGIPVISLANNLGIGGAVQTGYKYAYLMGYDAAVQFDGDGQHDIDSLEKLVVPVLNGEADMTVGSRFVENTETDNFQSTFMRRIGIRFLSGIIYMVSHLRIKDCTSGFRAANKSVIEFLSKDYPFDYPEPESLVNVEKRKLRCIEIPVHMRERSGGKSSIRAWKSVYYMIKVTLAILIAGIQKKEVR